MQDTLVDTFIRLRSKQGIPEELVLDFDATDDLIHGDQLGKFFHGYYKSYCYMPLYTFCGAWPLGAILRPSNIDGCAGIGVRLDWYRDSTLKRVSRYQTEYAGLNLSETGWLSYTDDMSESFYIFDWETPGRLTQLHHSGVGSGSGNGSGSGSGSGSGGPPVAGPIFQLSAASSGETSQDVTETLLPTLLATRIQVVGSDDPDLHLLLYTVGAVGAAFDEPVSGRPSERWFDEQARFRNQDLIDEAIETASPAIESESEVLAAGSVFDKYGPDFVGPIPNWVDGFDSSGVSQSPASGTAASAVPPGSSSTTGGFELSYYWDFDEAGRIVQMETPDGLTDFDYDATDQLIEADHDYTGGDNLLTDEIHAWDANGNPDTSTALGRQVVTTDHNRLRYVYTENSTQLQIYSYDHEGNRTRWFYYAKINGQWPRAVDTDETSQLRLGFSQLTHICHILCRRSVE